MTEHILRNGMVTPDGTILISESRHDYVSHEDTRSGEYYMVDGGNDYLRRSVNNVQAYDISKYYVEGDHEHNRQFFSWGTYGPPEDPAPYHKVPLMHLSSAHIENILETQSHIPPWIRQLFKDEQAFRKPTFKYNHAYTLAFSVETNHGPDEDVDPAEITRAVEQRISELNDEGGWDEHLGRPFDSFEIEPIIHNKERNPPTS